MHACPRLGRGVGSARGRRARTPRRSNRCPRSRDCLYFYGRASWASGWSRRRPSCKEITADAGRGCPCLPGCRDGLPRAAAATGNAATRVARGSAASASRAPARICGSGKLGRESHNSSPIFEVGAQFSPPGCVARTPPGAPARAERALVGAPPYHFALDQFGRAVFAAAHLQKRRAGPFATRFKERSSRRAALGTARGSAAHPIQ